VDVYLIGGIDSAVSRYTLRRVAKLVLALLLVLAVISFLFQNWYTAIVSVGLLSLVMGLAVQTPVTSFLGWIYILVRAPYRVGERMMKQISVYREILAQTPVDQLEVREHPSVVFRVNANTWLDAIVRYLVHPREAGRVKTRLIKKLLAELKAAPDRVMFPKGNAR